MKNNDISKLILKYFENPNDHLCQETLFNYLSNFLKSTNKRYSYNEDSILDTISYFMAEKKEKLHSLILLDEGQIKLSILRKFKDTEIKQFREENRPKTNLYNMIHTIVKDNPVKFIKYYKYIGLPGFLYKSGTVEHHEDIPHLPFPEKIIKETKEKIVWISNGIKIALFTILDAVHKFTRKKAIVDYLYNKEYYQLDVLNKDERDHNFNNVYLKEMTDILFSKLKNNTDIIQVYYHSFICEKSLRETAKILNYSKNAISKKRVQIIDIIEKEIDVNNEFLNELLYKLNDLVIEHMKTNYGYNHE